MGSINPLIWSSWVDLHKVVLVECLRAVMRLMFMVALVRMCNSVCKHDSMESFEWLLIKLSLISRPVLVSDHFQRICLFLTLLTDLNVNQAKKAPDSWQESGLCLRITDNLTKNPFEIVYLGTLLSAACHKNTVPISLVESTRKMSELFDRLKYVLFY